MGLSTMSFYFLLDDEPIGMMEPVGADKGMGVVIGRFTPLPAYERVRTLFQQITAGISPPLPEVDEDAVDKLFRVRDSLNLTVITAGGQEVPTRALHVFDTGSDIDELGGYVAEFGVATTEFFDDPRYWSG